VAPGSKGESRVIDVAGLEALFLALAQRGFRVLGPTVRDGAIVLRELRSSSELPIGWRDVQEPGSYRLERRADDARFGFAVGPDSPKRDLLPPLVRLWRGHRLEDGSFEVEEEAPDDQPVALVGVRACDLAAVAVQDRVLRGDRDYAARRARTSFVVAVNCTAPASTCFCGSRGTGPAADSGFDLALTEILDGDHRFLVEIGSEAGRDLLAALPSREARAQDTRAAGAALSRATAQMAPGPPPEEARELLLRNLESSHWQDVAARCLSCGNCTLVCPTCFCTDVEDVTDLDGRGAERRRVWDTCFSLRYAEMHGGNSRPTPAARYRQWLTHKLATWQDQFGTSGCVGCGRCIAWCPVGIDIRDEVAAFREEQDAHS
jgi:ferredoxin